LQRPILVEREIRLDDELVVLDASPVELAGDVEEVFLVADLEDYGVGSLGDITVRGAFACGVHDLRHRKTDWEVSPNDYIVPAKTLLPRGIGGRKGRGRESRNDLRRSEIVLDDLRLGVETRVRGPLVGSTAVVVRSSCPTR